MARMELIDPDSAEGKTKELLDAAKKKMGKVPNIVRGVANSPAALEGYLNLSGALGGGVLTAKQRERISLVVGETNECHYCVSAHSAIGKSAGLSDEEIAESRRGSAGDPKDAAVVKLAKTLVQKRGNVSDAELKTFRDAGFGDDAIAEVVANVALNIFTNYFNHVADTPVDFPEAAPLEAAV